MRALTGSGARADGGSETPLVAPMRLRPPLARNTLPTRINLSAMTDDSNRKTTLEDLARLAGVSISTVSRALNDQAAISTRTKERIWALARDHNYPVRTTIAAPAGAEGAITIVTPHSRGRP